MCAVCEEFGRTRCPACEEKPERIPGYHCRHCGRDFPDEEEEIRYDGDYYCPECYEYKKEEEKAEAEKRLSTIQF